MEFKKLATILGGLIGLGIIALIAMSFFGSDESKIDLATLINTNQQAVALADEAAENLGDFRLQINAGEIEAIMASDNRQLIGFYQKNFGKKIPQTKFASNPLKVLSDTESGAPYTSKYRELMGQIKDRAQSLAGNLLNRESSPSLRSLISGYREHLSTLFADF